MVKNLIVALGVTALILASAQQWVHAHPVTYKGNVALMTWNQPFLNDVWLTYSFRPDMAVAGRFMRMDMPEGDSYFYAPQFDWLLRRWNGEDFQANIYVYGAFGGVHWDGSDGIGGLVGAEADAESLRWYVAGKWESLWTPEGPNFHAATGRLGIAPYKAEIDQVALWFMVQGQYHPSLSREWAVTPLLRVFYRNFLLEGGASVKGDWMVNGMIHF